MPNPELLASVKLYLNHGLSVLPLAPGKKTPITKNGVKDATSDLEFVLEYFAKPKNQHANIGIATGAPSGNVIVIDLDVDDDAGKDGIETLHTWEATYGALPDTVQSITPRGGNHLFYRVNRDIKNSTNEELAVDIRGTGGYVVAPPSHTSVGTYEWEFPLDEIAIAQADDNVYAFIDYVAKKNKKGDYFELPKQIGKGGRVNTLFKYASSLQSWGFSDDELIERVETANAERCTPPLSDKELKAKVIDGALNFDKGEKREPGKSTKRIKKPSSLQLAKQLISEYSIVDIDGTPAVYMNEHYIAGIDAIDAIVDDVHEDLTIYERRNIREDIRTQCRRNSVKMAPINLIAFNNGVLDIFGDGTLRPMQKDDYITNIIPHDYNPNAESQIVKDFLNAVTCGDNGLVHSLNEALGLCMLRGSKFPAGIFLLGNGANGKSTWLDAVRNVIGEQNTSTVQLKDFKNQFAKVDLMGKLVNIDDDMSATYIDSDGCSWFKKITAGNRIQSDVKYSNVVQFTPFCTPIHSANEMPKFKDTSYGLSRRIIPIPFNAKFDEGKADINMPEKLRTEQAAEYFIKRAVMALVTLFHRQKITLTPAQEALLGEIKTNNCNILQWMQEEMITAEILANKYESKSINDWYKQYRTWCEEANINAFERKNFTKFIKTEFGLIDIAGRVPEQFGGTKVAKIFKKLEEKND